MDGKRFDQIAKLLSNITMRREALKALAGVAATAGFGFAETSAKKKKKKKKKKTSPVAIPPPPPPPPPPPQACLERRRTCGAGVKCCNEDVGLTACRMFLTGTCSSLTGLRCCGLEGADCQYSVGVNNCDCCDGLYCGGTEGFGRCQEQPV